MFSPSSLVKLISCKISVFFRLCCSSMDSAWARSDGSCDCMYSRSVRSISSSNCVGKPARTGHVESAFCFNWQFFYNYFLQSAERLPWNCIYRSHQSFYKHSSQLTIVSRRILCTEDIPQPSDCCKDSPALFRFFFFWRLPLFPVKPFYSQPLLCENSFSSGDYHFFRSNLSTISPCYVKTLFLLEITTFSGQTFLQSAPVMLKLFFFWRLPLFPVKPFYSQPLLCENSFSSGDYHLFLSIKRQKLCVGT